MTERLNATPAGKKLSPNRALPPKEEVRKENIPTYIDALKNRIEAAGIQLAREDIACLEGLKVKTQRSRAPLLARLMGLAAYDKLYIAAVIDCVLDLRATKGSLPDAQDVTDEIRSRYGSGDERFQILPDHIRNVLRADHTAGWSPEFMPQLMQPVSQEKANAAMRRTRAQTTGTY